MSKLKQYTKEWLEELCATSHSYNEVLTKAGRAISGGNSSYLKKKISEFNIDVSHFTGQAWARDTHHNGYYKYKIEELFTANSSIQRNVIRRYVIDFNLLPYKCANCGNDGHWCNQILALELHHINGVNNDHRLENLQWLCPNCHAITDTYAGKNNRIK